jgi:phospholipid N-methyltransferase
MNFEKTKTHPTGIRIILEEIKGDCKLEIVEYKKDFFYNLYEKMGDEFNHITEGYLKNLDKKIINSLNNLSFDFLEEIWKEVLNPLEDST